MTLFIICRLIYEAYFRFPHFKILKAYMHKWINKRTGDMVTYQIEIKTKKNSSELVFEELWIDEKKYKFHLSRENRKIAGDFNEKEKLNLNVLSEILDEHSPLLSGKSSKGKLLLSYTFKNKRKFISIKKFRDFEELRLQG